MEKVHTPPRKVTQRRRTTRIPARRRPQSPTSAAFASTLIAHAFDLVHIIDATGTIYCVSPAITRVLGYQLEDVQGKDSFSFVHPDDIPRLRDATAEMLRQPGESSARQEYRVRHKDGSWRIFEGVATNLLEDPAVAGIVINARDITERVQTAALLQESEGRYRQLAELSPNPLFVHAEGKLLYVNAAAVTFFGAQSAEELIGSAVQGLIPPTHHELQQQRVRQILREGRAAQFLQFPFLRRDGRTVEAEAAGTAITYGGTPAVQTVVRELTVPPRDDQALRASEERYRLLFDNANDAIAAFTIDGIVTDVNQGAQALLGWTPEELIGQHYHKVLTPAAQGLAEERTRHYLAGEDMASIFEIDLLHKDGRVIPVEARTRPIRDRQGAVIGFQGIYRDITTRRRMEAALRENRRLLERIADTMPDIVYLYDYPTQQTVYINRQVIPVFGYTPDQLQSAPGPFRPLLHPEDMEPFAEQQQQLATAADGARIEAVYRVRHANGSYRWLKSRETVFRRTAEGDPAQIFGVAQDVTARQHVRQLGQEQRLRLEELPIRLRAFRDRLGLTQAAFGHTFGDYSARQITSYERGQIEIPLKLLLAIHAKGYLLEAVFGAGAEALLEETVHYLTSSYPERTLLVELAAAVLRLLVRDRTTIERVLRELELPVTEVPTEQKRLLDQLAGILPRRDNPAR